MITGKDLVAWGFEPSPWFTSAIAEANRLVAAEPDAVLLDVIMALQAFAPPPVDLRVPA